MGVWKVTLRLLVVVVACYSLFPASAEAQNTGIAGSVRDTSGAVLPGVTVEASSPALIEGTRSVVTDGQGLYQIVDLRPGRYVVTFALPGFQSVRREGIELIASFTATVNAELKIGSVAETITVSGDAPTVDTHNVVQQKVLSDEFREELPAARNVHNMAQLLPGTAMSSGTGRPSSQDVGGLSGDRGVVILHGSRSQDYDIQIDGSGLTYIQGVSQGMAFNPAEGQEYVYEMGGLSAENANGGFHANVVPKEGGNRFTGFFLATYTGGGLQSSNLDANLINNGLASVNELRYIYDYNAAFGGPLKKERLWFFTSFRRWGEKETVAGAFRPIDPLSFVYNPRLGAAGNVDLNQPDLYSNWNNSASIRLTWQANAKNKFGLYLSTQPREQFGMALTGTRVLEAAIDQKLPFSGNRMIQATWKSPITSRLLLTAVYGDLRSPIEYHELVPGLEANGVIGASDSATGFTFRSPPGTPGAGFVDCYCYTQPNIKSTLTYVTGTHVAKFGGAWEWGGEDVKNFRTAQSVNYVLQNAVPRQVSMFLTPRTERERYKDLGLFAQDQWTLNRFTINAGVRFDYHNEWVPDQTSGPGRFVPLNTSWPTLNDIPNWKDLSPRLGIGIDLFGTGKTALKATLNRYVIVDGIRFATSNNPQNFNVQATRAWNDSFFGPNDPRSGNYVPDCDLLNPLANDECTGPLSNRNFGTAVGTSRPDDAIRSGWGVRPYDWEWSGGIQHEIMSGVSASVMYFHRWYGNFTSLAAGNALSATGASLTLADNLAVTPNDYSPYCVTVPTDSRLPNSGGQLCGLYDISPEAAARQIDNKVTFAKNYGKETETYDGVDLTMNARVRNRVTLSGGISSGTSNNIDSINSRSFCFVVDNPQQLLNCDIKMPWRTSVRFLGSTTLPFGIETGLTFQNNPGPQITANYSITSPQAIGLGRNLTAGAATVPLIKPGTVFGDRMTQLDLRLGRSFKYKGYRIRALLDVANLFNSNSVLVLNTTYSAGGGGNWLRPSYVLPGRLIKPNLQIDF